MSSVHIKFIKSNLYSIILFLISLPYIYFVLWRIAIPLEINGNEPWNAYHIDNAFDLGRLYPDPSYMINNYTPFSYYFINLFNRFLENTIIAGRIISVLSILALSLAAYLTALELQSENRKAALFGAVWLFVTMFRGFVGYAGMNDPHLLGLAIMSWGFLYFLKYRNTRSLYLSFVIFIIAGLVKNSLFALPLSALIILAVERNQRIFKVIIFSIFLIAAICLVLYNLYGPLFFSQLLIPREIKPIRILQSAQRLQWVVIPLLFWFFWLKSNFIKSERLITLIIVVTSIFIFFATGVAEGVGTNAIFELVYATAICTSIAINYVANRSFRSISLANIFFILLVLRTVATLHSDPYYLIISKAYRDDVSNQVQIMRDEVERVKKMNDPITCSLVTVCYLAGKEYHANGRFVELSSRGHWTIKQ